MSIGPFPLATHTLNTSLFDCVIILANVLLFVNAPNFHRSIFPKSPHKPRKMLKPPPMQGGFCCECLAISHFLYSKISPGWHLSALQIASRVDKRIALALPFFKIEIFAIMMPTFSASSVTLIFRFANITSMFMIIAIALNG